MNKKFKVIVNGVGGVAEYHISVHDEATAKALGIEYYARKHRLGALAATNLKVSVEEI